MSDRVSHENDSPLPCGVEKPVSTCIQQFRRRCPKLGHDLEFAYCERENAGMPCGKALVCWNEAFDVRRHFLSCLAAEDFEECFAKPVQPKALSLLHLIERAKRLNPKD